MVWMHTTAAYKKYGDAASVTAAIARHEIALDNGLPVEGEHAGPSHHLAQRMAIIGSDIPLDRLSHATHEGTKR